MQCPNFSGANCLLRLRCSRPRSVIMWGKMADENAKLEVLDHYLAAK
jgi:hypothetical protein